MSKPRIVGVDWGTSSLRAALLGPDGTIEAERRSAEGILKVRNGAFATVLRRELTALDAPPDMPIVLSGMITSRQGWHECPYLACPADAAALAGALCRVSEPGLGPLHFITGLEHEGPDGLPDVMRGEETQIIGQDDLAPGELVVLPGTHSKWVAVEEGRIMRFRTWMTGEVFAVLKAHSILGRLMREGPSDEAGFARGVRAGLDGSGPLGRLFSARTLPLTGRLAEEAVADYLSGLLIGAEIAEAVAAERPSGVVVVGSDELTERYSKALDIARLDHRPGRAQAAARGQWRIAAAAGLVP